MLRFVKKIWYNKRIRICVIFMLVLLCLLIVFSWGLYRKLHRNRLYPVEQLSTPEQQLSALTLYYDFLGGMTSGKIIKTSCSFESLYDFVSSTTETITFTQTEDDKRILTYQQRQPIDKYGCLFIPLKVYGIDLPVPVGQTGKRLHKDPPAQKFFPVTRL